MTPSIYPGDRILMFKTFSLSPLNKVFPLTMNQPVLFSFPFSPQRRNCLRVAGLPGHTIAIDSGVFKNSIVPFRPPKTNPALDLVPAEYAPRDFMTPYTIPRPGETLDLDSMSIRDFLFTVSLIRQELNREHIRVTAHVIIGDSVSSDYIINGFSLYSGSIAEIPDSLQTYWFFWTQLENYLKSQSPDRQTSVKFTIKKQDKILHKYTVRNSHYFLLADNWVSGYDSRYFGLVERTLITGRPFMIWWSTANANGRTSISRIGRIIL